MDWFTWLTIAFLPLAAWLYIRDRRRQRETVEEWAVVNQVTLLHRLPTWYRFSPFVLSILLGSYQRVEYWLVRDEYGMERRVWLKLGNFFLGATREITAKWEE